MGPEVSGSGTAALPPPSPKTSPSAEQGSQLRHSVHSPGNPNSRKRAHMGLLYSQIHPALGTGGYLSSTNAIKPVKLDPSISLGTTGSTNIGPRVIITAHHHAHVHAASDLQPHRTYCISSTAPSSKTETVEKSGHSGGWMAPPPEGNGKRRIETVTGHTSETRITCAHRHTGIHVSHEMTPPELLTARDRHFGTANTCTCHAHIHPQHHSTIACAAHYLCACAQAAGSNWKAKRTATR